MKKAYKAARKLVVSTIGFSVLVLGIILIPLPGPGILVSILGLIILSWEYAWAERHLNRAKSVYRKSIDKARSAKKPPPENT
ncbi:MAG: PGPGW domain-containing protein [Patescibacteria group bacterium]